MGIFVDDLFKGSLVDLQFLLRDSMLLELLRHKELLGDLDLLLCQVTGHIDKLHPVEQSRLDAVYSIGRCYEHYVRKVVIDIEVVVVESRVLLRVEDLEKSGRRIAFEVASEFVDLVENHYRVGSAGLVDSVKDTSRKGAYVCFPVTTDLGLVMHAAEGDTDILASEGPGDRLSEACLADSRRAVEAEDRGFHVTLQLEDGTIISNKLIMTDAAINPGNSGGALLDGKGRLIGIVNSKYVNSYVEAAGYAIPISSAKPILECLMSGTEIKDSDRDDSTSGKATDSSSSTRSESAQTAYLGINGVDITKEMAENYGMPEGIYISRVYEQGGAAKAGISKRDIITAVNGEAVLTMTKLQSVLSGFKPGDTIKITIARYENNYIETDVDVTLGDRSTAQ